MYNRIYWQDGTLLTAKHFELQDTLHYQTLSQAVSLPYQMEYGVAKLVIDFRLLELGTIKIDELLLYTKEKFFIYHVSKGPLKLKISEDNTSPIVSIYVSSKDISTEKDDLPLLTPHYYLSDKPDENVAHQFKLLELLNVNKKWQLNDYSPALISCASSTLAYTLDELAKLLISVKHFIEHQQGNINNHYLLQTQFHSCEKLLQACTNTSTHFHPYSLFDGFENLYFLITLIEEISTKSFGYDFYRPHQSFKALLNAFYEILKKPIRQQFITLKRENNAYVATNLNNAFIEAKEYFLIIRKLSPDAEDLNMDYIKLSSVERNRHINQMSLSGIHLEHLPNHGIHQLYDSLIYRTYRLIPSGELDYVIKERSIMFRAIKNCNKYQFSLYYR
tara:strand:+ start:5343 stop:6512 length:1170 start_codon:yes stop_codon:yes gene_type:complete